MITGSDAALRPGPQGPTKPEARLGEARGLVTPA